MAISTKLKEEETCFVEKWIQTLEHEECNKSPVWDEDIAAFSHL